MALRREHEQDRPGSVRPLTPFAVVFEHHQAVALLIDPETTAIIDANPAAAAFYGRDLDQLRSMSLAEIEQSPIEVVRDECALAARQVRQRFEVPHRTANGEVRYVEVISSPIRLDEQPYLCAIVIDISRRREMEREHASKSRDLATLLEVSQAMTRTLDLGSVSQTIIEKATNLIGLQTGAIYLLRGPELHLEATTPPLPPDMPEEFRRARLEDHPQIHASFRLGEPLAIEETAGFNFTPQEQAIINMRGLRSLLYIPLIIERRPIGVLILGSVGQPRSFRPDEIDLCRTFSVQAAVTAENALMYDTTSRYALELESRIVERDRAQQERVKLEQQLFQVQRRESIGTLAAGIAHDFNNILSIIVGNASLLSSGAEVDEKASRRIGAILMAANRASQVVQQLLTVARKTEMDRRPTDVNKLVLELSRLIEETFPRNISVRHDLEPSLSPIQADPNQLHQVLLNLCVNARDAMPAGGELIIATKILAAADLPARLGQVPPRSYVQIVVRDTGSGMDESTKARAFTPFFTTKGVGQGSGLGLAVSQGIVESHGGFIDVQSEVGAGTTMHVFLPAESARPARADMAGSATQAGLSLSGVVLLVEDEPLLRESTADTLSQRGLDVLSAANGDEALEQLRRRPSGISLVLSDLGLPGYDGEELYRRLRAEGRTIPFVLMTGFIEADRRSALMRSGVRDIIMKPFEAAEIIERIRGLLHP